MGELKSSSKLVSIEEVREEGVRKSVEGSRRGRREEGREEGGGGGRVKKGLLEGGWGG